MGVTSKTTSKTESDTKTNGPKNETASNIFKAYLEDIPLLDDEDDVLFRQTVEILLAETGATSFLEQMAIKDLVEKLYEEQRYKAISVEVIKGSRLQTFMLADKGEQELEAARQYLPKISALDRMISNSQAGRRMLLKELRHRASDSPPLAPKL